MHEFQTIIESADMRPIKFITLYGKLVEELKIIGFKEITLAKPKTDFLLA